MLEFLLQSFRLTEVFQVEGVLMRTLESASLTHAG